MEDNLADTQTPEYDTILALSLTKWIHLNWGDAGIKRFFRRIYNHLRPGGRLVLEPQPFGSYAKKKKLTVSSPYNVAYTLMPLNLLIPFPGSRIYSRTTNLSLFFLVISTPI